MADINITYVNLLNILGAAVPNGVRRGDEYRLEVRDITRVIPVSITVNNDRENRIQSAFAKVFSDLGFRSGINNPHYILRANVTLSHLDFQNDINRFAQIELNANLTDTATGEILLPFSFNNREGHSTAAAAENRAFISAERIIEAEYKELLSAYLSQLLPER